MDNKIGFIEAEGKTNWRWKLRIRKTYTHASWIEVPERWQMCITEGDNVVWNDTRSLPLRQDGEEVWVVMKWLPTILGHKRMMEGEGVQFEPVAVDAFGKAIAEQTTDNKVGMTNYSEQRIYVDFNQQDNIGLPNL